MTQRERVYSMLRDSPQGVTNGEFIDAHLPRFSARIEELRKAGHEISTQRVREGQWIYTLDADSSGGLRPVGDPPAASSGVHRRRWTERRELVWSWIPGERRSWIRTQCPPEGKLPHVDSLAQEALWA